MEVKEKKLAKADIRRVANKKRLIIKIVYVSIVVAILVIGLISGTKVTHHEGGYTVYGSRYPAHDTKTVGWFGVVFSRESEGWQLGGSWGSKSEKYDGNVILVTIMFIVLIGWPFFIDEIYRIQCKNTVLQVSESKVYGSYSSFIFKKSLEIPIEKVDNLTVFSGLMDKLRTGVTLGVCSASSIIKIHFVQNAEDVVAATMNRIKEIKENKNHIIKQMGTGTSVSTSDKLKNLSEMKNAGLITEEEFAKKREEIIANM